MHQSFLALDTPQRPSQLDAGESRSQGAPKQHTRPNDSRQNDKNPPPTTPTHDRDRPGPRFSITVKGRVSKQRRAFAQRRTLSRASSTGAHTETPPETREDAPRRVRRGRRVSPHRRGASQCATRTTDADSIITDNQSTRRGHRVCCAYRNLHPLGWRMHHRPTPSGGSTKRAGGEAPVPCRNKCWSHSP